LTSEKAGELLFSRIEEVDFQKAREDVFPFISNPKDLDVWSRDFFKHIASRILYA